MTKLLPSAASLFLFLAGPAWAADCRQLAFCAVNKASMSLNVEYSESGACTLTSVKSGPRRLRYEEALVIPLEKRSSRVTVCIRKLSPDGRYTVGFDAFPDMRTVCLNRIGESTRPSEVCPYFVTYTMGGQVSSVENPDYEPEEPL
jgi:hypothetical protein